MNRVRVKPCVANPQSESGFSDSIGSSSSSSSSSSSLSLSSSCTDITTTAGVHCLTTMRLLLLTVLLYAALTTGNCLQVLKVDLPSVVDPRSEKVTLRCVYDLEGKELYSVKWYKDGDEFFTFMPSMRPPGREFDYYGVKVDVGRSDSKQVILLGQAHSPKKKINLAGSYSCEVSVEAPSYYTAFASANMTVAVLPHQDPALEGLRLRTHYDVGDMLKVNCTSAPSYPPAVLSFLLNHKEASKSLTKRLPSVGQIEGNVVDTTRLGIAIKLERHHFPGGNLSLICRSALPGVPGAEIRKSEAVVTLAASNQRLAQEPPTSATSVSYEPTFLRILIPAITLLHRLTSFTV